MRGNFEAKKHAYRQTQDGVVVSFVMHPNDVTPDFAAAALGTIFVIGYATPDEAEGGDAQSPGPTPTPRQFQKPSDDAPVAEHRAGNGGAPKREAPQRCPTVAPDRLVQLLGIECGNPKFQAWLKSYVDLSGDLDHQGAIACVHQLLGVKSRGEIATNPAARQKALDLMTDYDIHIGKHAKDYTA